MGNVKAGQAGTLPSDRLCLKLSKIGLGMGVRRAVPDHLVAG